MICDEFHLERTTVETRQRGIESLVGKIMETILFSFDTRYADVEEQSLECAVSVAENMVNNFSFDAKEIVEYIRRSHPIVQDFFERVFYLWVLYGCYYRQNNFWDDRNRYSTEKCQWFISNIPDFLANSTELENSPFVSNSLDENMKIVERSLNRSVRREMERLCPGYSRELFFVARLARAHRTLYQSFSKIVFYYLNETCAPIKKMVEDGELSESWWRCPLV